jgi:hypothetical protein
MRIIGKVYWIKTKKIASRKKFASGKLVSQEFGPSEDSPHSHQKGAIFIGISLPSGANTLGILALPFGNLQLL